MLEKLGDPASGSEAASPTGISGGALAYLPSAFSIAEPVDGADQPIEVTFIGDDPELAAMYQLKLQLDGYGVTLVTTDEARSVAARRRTLDIVFLDIGWLSPASLATHRMLRSHAATKYVPIVLLSSRLAREAASHGLKLGVHDLLISSATMRPQAFWSQYSAAERAGH